MKKFSLLWLASLLVAGIVNAQSLTVQSSIAFERGSSALSPQYKKQLRADARNLSTLLRYSPDASLQIAGYADSDDANGARLADARAQTVWEFLIAAGLPAERMEPVGYGTHAGGSSVEILAPAELIASIPKLEPAPVAPAEPAPTAPKRVTPEVAVAAPTVEAVEAPETPAPSTVVETPPVIAPATAPGTIEPEPAPAEVVATPPPTAIVIETPPAVVVAPVPAPAAVKPEPAAAEVAATPPPAAIVVETPPAVATVKPAPGKVRATSPSTPAVIYETKPVPEIKAAIPAGDQQQPNPPVENATAQPPAPVVATPEPSAPKVAVSTPAVEAPEATKAPAPSPVVEAPPAIAAVKPAPVPAKAPKTPSASTPAVVYEAVPVAVEPTRPVPPSVAVAVTPPSIPVAETPPVTVPAATEPERVNEVAVTAPTLNAAAAQEALTPSPVIETPPALIEAPVELPAPVAQLSLSEPEVQVASIPPPAAPVAEPVPAPAPKILSPVAAPAAAAATIPQQPARTKAAKPAKAVKSAKPIPPAAPEFTDCAQLLLDSSAATDAPGSAAVAVAPEPTEEEMAESGKLPIRNNQLSSTYTRPYSDSTTAGAASYYIQNTAFFNPCSNTLTVESMASLNSVARQLQGILRRDASLRVDIAGHADSLTEASQVDVLAQARADALVGALTLRGIDRSRLNATSFGGRMPLTSKPGDPARELNCRAEIRVPN